MAIATLICSIISASVAVINMLVAIKNSILDIDIDCSLKTINDNNFLRIGIENNSDISTKIKGLIVESSSGVLKATQGTSMFMPFIGSETLLSHDSVRYGYRIPSNDSFKKVTIIFSGRISLLSHKKVIFLN